MAHYSSKLLEKFKDNPYRKDISYKKGELIFFPDKNNTICYIVISGYARVYTIDKQGNEVIQSFYSTGSMFPLSWINDKHNPSAFMNAMTDCIIAQIPITEVRRVVNHDIETANLMIQYLGDQFAIYANRIGDLSYKLGRQRLASRLLLLTYRFGITLPDGAGLELPPFTQNDIGSTINMSREGTNRELRKFESEGALSFSHNRIIILNKMLLRNEIGDSNDSFYFDEE